MRRVLIFVAVALGCFLADATEAYSQRRGTVTSSYTEITRTRVVKERKKIPIRWQHTVDLTYSQFIGATYTGGWRFGNFLYLGFGTGVQVNYMRVMPWDENGQYVISDFRGDYADQKIEGYNTFEDVDGTYQAGRVQVPVYVHVKFRFLKKKVSPYLSASGGFNVYRSLGYEKGSEEYDPDYGYYTAYTVSKGGIHAGGYAEAMIGVDFRLRNDSNITFGLGPIWQGIADGYDRNIYFYDDYVNTDNDDALVGFKLGYSF